MPVHDGLIVNGMPNSRTFMAVSNLTNSAAQPADSPVASWVPYVALRLAAE